MVVFIGYIGNKDTSVVYPKSLCVNRKNVLEALLWLKKQNPLYSDISIRESNLNWMQGEEEVSIATNAEKSKQKTQGTSESFPMSLNLSHCQRKMTVLIVTIL